MTRNGQHLLDDEYALAVVSVRCCPPARRCCCRGPVAIVMHEHVQAHRVPQHSGRRWQPRPQGPGDVQAG
jgi:hypothetical protein